VEQQHLKDLRDLISAYENGQKGRKVVIWDGLPLKVLDRVWKGAGDNCSWPGLIESVKRIIKEEEAKV